MDNCVVVRSQNQIAAMDFSNNGYIYISSIGEMKMYQQEIMEAAQS
jgi:hypothetical protein